MPRSRPARLARWLQAAGLVTVVVTSVPWMAGPAEAAPAVTVTPSTGLVEGQKVTVAITGFPPDATLNVRQCITTPVTGDDCDFENLENMESDQSGAGSVEYAVRVIPLPGSAGKTSVICNGSTPCSITVSADLIDLTLNRATTPVTFATSATAAPTTSTTTGVTSTTTTTTTTPGTTTTTPGATTTTAPGATTTTAPGATTTTSTVGSTTTTVPGATTTTTALGSSTTTTATGASTSIPAGPTPPATPPDSGLLETLAFTGGGPFGLPLGLVGVTALIGGSAMRARVGESPFASRVARWLGRSQGWLR